MSLPKDGELPKKGENMGKGMLTVRRGAGLKRRRHAAHFLLASLLAIFGLLASPKLASAQTAKNRIVALDDQLTAFINVNVVPMDTERALTKQTVVVKDGRIVAMGPAAKTRVPKGAVRIDGNGKYLMPGLADMHIHLPYNKYDREDAPAMLELFIVNGVTTALNLQGLPEHLQIREQIAQAKMLGPVIYTSGFFINEPYFKTPEAVERQVIKEKQAGYDFIKMHGNLSREAYHRLFEVARREGMRVIGHVPKNLGVSVTLEEKQEVIAHAEEYLYGYFLFNRTCCTAEELKPMIREIAESTAKAGTWVIPTLTIFKGIAPQIDDLNAMLQRPEMKYVPKGIATEWRTERNRYKGRKREEIPTLQNLYLLQELLVRGLRDAKVRLLLGTDSPATVAVAPGFSVHDELKNLVAAGLTPYEALRAATANAAEFLNATDEFGTVAVGRRADLIMVNANPLTDVGAVAQPSGVMVRGRWLSQAVLQAKLAELANSTAKK